MSSTYLWGYISSGCMQRRSWFQVPAFQAPGEGSVQGRQNVTCDVCTRINPSRSGELIFIFRHEDIYIFLRKVGGRQAR